MIRITLNSVVILLVMWVVVGCSNSKYKHRRLTEDSRQGRAIVTLVESLQHSADDIERYIAAHGASNLTASQARGLEYALKTIAEAEDVEIAGMDAFGKRIYRVTLILKPKEATIAMLLVEADDKSLKWAGAN